MSVARLIELRASRGIVQAKLDAIIASDTGFDGSGQGVSIMAATERYKSLLVYYDTEIEKENARTPTQRRLNVMSW